MDIVLKNIDKEELDKAIRRGFVALHDVNGCFLFSLEPPLKFEQWQKENNLNDDEAFEEIKKSLILLKEVLNQLEEVK